CIKDSTLTGFIELATFHTDQKTREEIRKAFDNANAWLGWLGSNVERIYTSIWKKCSVYKPLAEELAVPYIVSIFGDFAAAVHIDEVRQCLFDKDHGLFAMYPDVSGLIFFAESGGVYSFAYIANPIAA